jgi:cell division protein FtsI/penicillin-binding protein 2
MKTSSKFQSSKAFRRRETTLRPGLRNPAVISWRFQLARAALLLIAAVLILRLAQIQVFNSRSYVELGRQQYMQKYVLRANRGLIYDRNLTPLALNKISYDVGVDKHFVKNLETTSRKLAKVLSLSQKEIADKIRRSKGFVMLERKVSEKTAAEIQILNLPGVKVTELSQRVYPLNEKLAPVIGFVDVDGRGLSGLEFAYDDYLAGVDGLSVLQRDATGKTVMPIASRTLEGKSGHDLILTVDHNIQIIAEEELAKGIAKFNAAGGNAIVLDPNSGEILAMASAPSFDANHATRYDADAWRIRPITDLYEPGSTFKIVTMAAALANGKKRLDDIIFCENGKYRLYGHEINDPEKMGWQSFKNVFVKSSNIGAAKIARELGKDRLFVASRSFGFGNKTGVELPGEVSGMLKNPTNWSAFSVAAISYGHEVAATPLQIAMAYAAIANGGHLLKPVILKEIRTKENKTVSQSRRQVIRTVLDDSTSQKMIAILEQVVEEGTGQQAQIKGRRIAGKTGTAQKPRAGSYSDSDFFASFVGFYPARGAKILIYVALDEPKPVHSGGHVAAPVFRNILQRILQVYDFTEPRLDSGS